MSAALKHVGVDQNTMVVNASNAELYIAVSGKYGKKKHSSHVKLSAFATQYAAAIHSSGGSSNM